jgi:hypothetical protein
MSRSTGSARSLEPGTLAFFDCDGVRLMLEDRSIVEVRDLHNDSVLYFQFFEEPGGGLLSLISRVTP